MAIPTTVSTMALAAGSLLMGTLPSVPEGAGLSCCPQCASVDCWLDEPCRLHFAHHATDVGFPGPDGRIHGYYRCRKEGRR